MVDEMSRAYNTHEKCINIIAEKPEGKIPRGRLDDNNEMDVTEL
jgi:hypothetical protein